jgi:hypothetical protein
MQKLPRLYATMLFLIPIVVAVVWSKGNPFATAMALAGILAVLFTWLES